MPEDTLNKARILKFSAESVILKEGEINLDMYKIIKGNAEVYVGYGTKHETLIGIIGPQACFGEFGLLLHKPAIYTIIAYSELLVLRITEGEMGNFVQENHKNIIDIMRNMANIMMTMSLQINMLLKEIEEGKEPDLEEIKALQKTIRRSSIFNPNFSYSDYYSSGSIYQGNTGFNTLDKKV